MNERIREMAYKTCFESGFNGPEHFVFYHTDLQKFAELIVKECADILMKPEYAMNHPEELGDYNKGWVNGRLIGIEHIKEHFGVEE